MKLQKCNVTFNESEHTYHHDGKQLSGITAMLDKYILGGKYENLKKDEKTRKTVTDAAAKGKLVHQQAQYLVDKKFKVDEVFYDLCEPETSHFVQLVKDKLLSFAKSEYLVSDLDYYASSIDLVDNKCNLYDIKTTATLEKEYVRWQLSIYKYLFELQNPDVKVGRLYAIHLTKEKAELVEVAAIDKDIVISLLNANKEGADWSNPFDNLGNETDEVMEDYIDFDEKLKVAEGQKKEILERVKEQLDAIEKEIKEIKREKERCRSFIDARMREVGSYSARGNGWLVTRNIDERMYVFDEDAFANEKPKMYSKYVKEVVVPGSIRITKSKK